MRFELRLHGLRRKNRAVFEQLIAWAEQLTNLPNVRLTTNSYPESIHLRPEVMPDNDRLVYIANYKNEPCIYAYRSVIERLAPNSIEIVEEASRKNDWEGEPECRLSPKFSKHWNQPIEKQAVIEIPSRDIVLRRALSFRGSQPFEFAGLERVCRGELLVPAPTSLPVWASHSTFTGEVTSPSNSTRPLSIPNRPLRLPRGRAQAEKMGRSFLVMTISLPAACGPSSTNFRHFSKNSDTSIIQNTGGLSAPSIFNS